MLQNPFSPASTHRFALCSILFIIAFSLTLAIGSAQAFADEVVVEKGDSGEAVHELPLDAKGELYSSADNDEKDESEKTNPVTIPDVGQQTTQPADGEIVAVTPNADETNGQPKDDAEEKPAKPSKLVAVLRANNELNIRVYKDGDEDLIKKINAVNRGSEDHEGHAESADSTNAGGSPPLSGSGVFDDEAPLSEDLRSVLAMYELGDGTIAEGQKSPWFKKRELIRKVSFGEGVKPLSVSKWFSGMKELEGIDLRNLDTSLVRDMSSLFSDCSSLLALDFSGFNTSHVTDMSKMFAGCNSIEELDLSSFDTSAVTSMVGMFFENTSLKKVDLSKFDTSNVVDMSDMFSGCTSVEALDLSSFNTESLLATDGMFADCTSLAALDVSGFTADQLGAASIPIDNEGGFWYLSVPAGYETGVTLREPSEEERASAGFNVNPSKQDDPKPDDSGNNGGQGSNSGSESNNKTDPSGEDNPSPVKPDDPSKHNENNSNGANAAEAEKAASSVSGAISNLVSAESPQSAGYAAFEEDESVSANPIALTVDTEALTSVLSMLGSSVFGSSPGSSVDVSQVAETTASVLSSMGIGVSVDKTMAMLAAAIGMMIAAGLLLTLCFKIR